VGAFDQLFLGEGIEIPPDRRLRTLHQLREFVDRTATGLCDVFDDVPLTGLR